MRRCQATTLTSTYADSHRCLKRHGIEKRGKLYLCLHHRNALKARLSLRTF